MKTILHICDCHPDEARAIFAERATYYGLNIEPELIRKSYAAVSRSKIGPLNFDNVEALIGACDAKILLIDRIEESDFPMSGYPLDLWHIFAEKHGVRLIAWPASSSLLTDCIELSRKAGRRSNAREALAEGGEA